MIELYVCAQCGRHFGSESAIREHQDVFAILHRFDPEIEEHDGNPWEIVKIIAGNSYGHGSRYFAVEKIDVGHDGDTTWIVGKRLGRTSSLCPHDLASLLSGDRDISAAGHHRARAFAAAIALGLDARIDDCADPEWSMEEHLHNREMAYSARPDAERMAAEFCLLQSAVAVFAAQQARLDR